MKRTIRIDPVTRIEGHAKVFINLDESGKLEDAGLVVNELRGFEKILIGMEADRMPHVTARICGVCPTAHHLAACHALDRAAGAGISASVPFRPLSAKFQGDRIVLQVNFPTTCPGSRAGSRTTTVI